MVANKGFSIDMGAEHSIADVNVPGFDCAAFIFSRPNIIVVQVEKSRTSKVQ
jgi:hypothetical protein